jgi:hypothetical protein
MRSHDIQTLYAYNAWTNIRSLDTAARVPAERVLLQRHRAAREHPIGIAAASVQAHGSSLLQSCHVSNPI